MELEKAIEKCFTEEEKLFEEDGEVEGFGGRDDLPEGVAVEMKFTSEVKGIRGKFPNGKDEGSATMTRHSDGTVDAICRGVLTTDKGAFEWHSHEMSKVEGKKLKGLDIVTGTTKSRDLSWMNEVIIVLETKHDPDFKKYKNTAYVYKLK